MAVDEAGVRHMLGPIAERLDVTFSDAFVRKATRIYKRKTRPEWLFTPDRWEDFAEYVKATFGRGYRGPGGVLLGEGVGGDPYVARFSEERIVSGTIDRVDHHRAAEDRPPRPRRGKHEPDPWDKRGSRSWGEPLKGRPIKAGPVFGRTVIHDPEVRSEEDLRRLYPLPEGHEYGHYLFFGEYRPVIRRTGEKASYSFEIKGKILRFEEAYRDGRKIVVETTEVPRVDQRQGGQGGESNDS